MRFYGILVLLVAMLLLPGITLVGAQETAPETIEQLEVGAGITPDSPLHGLDKALERFQLLLTFEHEKKAELHYNFAQERLAEAEAMADRGRPELAEQSVAEYEAELGQTNAEIEQAIALGRNVTALSQHVEQMTSKHIAVLQTVHEKVPEVAKPAIQRAINASLERQGEIVSRVEGRELVETTIVIEGRELVVRVPELVEEKLEEKGLVRIRAPEIVEEPEIEEEAPPTEELLEEVVAVPTVNYTITLLDVEMDNASRLVANITVGEENFELRIGEWAQLSDGNVFEITNIVMGPARIGMHSVSFKIIKGTRENFTLQKDERYTMADGNTVKATNIVMGPARIGVHAITLEISDGNTTSIAVASNEDEKLTFDNKNYTINLVDVYMTESDTVEANVMITAVERTVTGSVSTRESVTVEL